jgi:hypothetical protein
MSVVTRLRHTEGEDLQLLARPEAGGSTLYRTEVASGTVTLSVYNSTGSSATALYTKPLDTDSDPTGADDECMFAALQTDGTWPLGGGYSFAAVLRDSEYHLEGGGQYTVEVVFASPGHSTPAWPQKADYGDLVYVWQVEVVPVTGL